MGLLQQDLPACLSQRKTCGVLAVFRNTLKKQLYRAMFCGLASQLMLEAAQRYDIASDTLTLHQDRVAPMAAHCYLNLLSEPAITASYSCPRVSND